MLGHIRHFLLGSGYNKRRDIYVYLMAHICIKTTYVLCHVTASLYSGIFPQPPDILTEYTKSTKLYITKAYVRYTLCFMFE